MSQSASLSLPVIDDGRFHDYVFKVSEHRLWRGLIGALRLDPCIKSAGPKLADHRP